MRKIKDGNVIYLVKKDENSMDLRCNNCGEVRNEADITVVLDKNTNIKKYKCECGCSTFTPQIDLEEYYI